MTVQAGTEISLELMVGEFEQQACELPEHDTNLDVHDNGPATHYVMGIHPGCPTFQKAEAVCSRAASTIIQYGSEWFECSRCASLTDLNRLFKVISPITY